MLVMALNVGPTPVLAPIFTDHAVLQRQRPIPIFGEAAPGQRVRIRLGREVETVTADDKGAFRAVFPARKGGSDLEISLDGVVVARDVAIGEVWIASGQSNMEWPQAASDDFERAKTEARPDVRMLTVQKDAAYLRRVAFDGQWVVASPETVGSFSGVGNAFAKVLAKELKVPVGIIHTSWGGSYAQAWTPREVLATDPRFAADAAAVKVPSGARPQTLAESRAGIAALRDYRAQYEAKRRELEAREITTPPGSAPWRLVAWPFDFNEFAGREIDGSVWVRKTFTVSPQQANRPLTFRLGIIDDFDTAYVDGARIGATDRGTREWYRVERAYPHPGLPAGEHTLTIRVVDVAYAGGWTKDGPKPVIEVEGAAPIPLAGEAEAYLETDLDGASPIDPTRGSNPNVPGVLYDGMIAPLKGIPVRGAIWYQGESNAGRPEEYRDLMAMLIGSWRETFADRKMPFYIVSLASFMARTNDANENGWGGLREAQRQITLTVPQTGQALALDLGEANDIHPRNKREVGRRLALQALAKTYGKRIIADGPALRSARWRGDAVELSFHHAQGLRTTDGQAPREFAVKTNGQWTWGVAERRGETVVVKSAPGTVIEAVRYAWANNPDVNLVNGAGLPAQPFTVSR